MDLSQIPVASDGDIAFRQNSSGHNFAPAINTRHLDRSKAQWRDPCICLSLTGKGLYPL